MHQLAHTRAWPQTQFELWLKNMIQAFEIFSNLNHHGAREEFKLPPEKITQLELIQHYIDCGRAAEIAEIMNDAHSHLNVLGASQVIGFDVRILPEEYREIVLLTIWEFWHDLFSRYPQECHRVLNLEDST